MQAAATSVALFVTKQYSTVALQYLVDSLSNTFWKSTAPDTCRLIREEVKRIVPLSEIQVIYALSASCSKLRERSPLIETLLTNLSEEAAKIHHELHLIRLAILEHEQPWSQRAYYGVFSWFGRSLNVKTNIATITDAAIELRRNFKSINEWVQTGITLEMYNRQITEDSKKEQQQQNNTTITNMNDPTTTKDTQSVQLIHEQQGKWLMQPPVLSSIHISDPHMIDKMEEITRTPHLNPNRNAGITVMN